MGCWIVNGVTNMIRSTTVVVCLSYSVSSSLWLCPVGVWRVLADVVMHKGVGWLKQDKAVLRPKDITATGCWVTGCKGRHKDGLPVKDEAPPPLPQVGDAHAVHLRRVTVRQTLQGPVDSLTK